MLTLDLKIIEETIFEQDLKRWWVAEQAGVHRTTLRRWLSGGIQKVKPENVTTLARVLQLEPSRIVLVHSSPLCPMNSPVPLQ